jgi:hypothetical protein
LVPSVDFTSLYRRRGRKKERASEREREREGGEESERGEEEKKNFHFFVFFSVEEGKKDCRCNY